ncbi:MAG: hypothetical protein ACI4WT_06365 [Oligosphaeraceae bacterium]
MRKRQGLAGCLMLALLTLCVGAPDLLGEAPHNSDSNPLSRLTGEQRKQYEAYLEYNGYLKLGQGFSRAALCQKLYGHAAQWCAQAAPKYRENSLRATERAAATSAERRKKELEELGVFYLKLSEQCQKAARECQKGDIAATGKALREYAALERQGQARQQKTYRRDWLTEPEINRVYVLVKRLEQSKGNSTAAEPKARQVENAEGYQHKSQNDRKPRRK